MSVYSIFNKVINKYSILVRKNDFNTKYVFTIPKWAQGSQKITLLCLINRMTGKLITLVPKMLLFVDKVEHLILDWLCKTIL